MSGLSLRGEGYSNAFPWGNNSARLCYGSRPTYLPKNTLIILNPQTFDIICISKKNYTALQKKKPSRTMCMLISDSHMQFITKKTKKPKRPSVSGLSLRGEGYSNVFPWGNNSARLCYGSYLPTYLKTRL